MNTMRAMVLNYFGGPLTLRDVPTPSPAADEVQVAVLACGVCRTDLKLQHGLFADTPLPFVLGHEIAGQVIAAGGRDGEPLIGQRVAVPLSWTCGACPACRRGADQFCEAMRGRPGFTVNGGFQDVLCVPVRSLVPLPGNLDPIAAALLADCITTVHHAIERARVQPDERVLVIGAGGLGLHAIQLLVHRSRQVTVSEIHPDKRIAAAQQGAHNVLSPAELAATPPANGRSTNGFDVAFDFVGNESSTSAALERLLPGGRLVLVGYTPGADVRSEVMTVVSNERAVLGSRSSTLADLTATSALLAAGAVRAVVDRTYPLENANGALADLEAGHLIGRGVIDLRSASTLI